MARVAKVARSIVHELEDVDLGQILSKARQQRLVLRSPLTVAFVGCCCVALLLVYMPGGLGSWLQRTFFVVPPALQLTQPTFYLRLVLCE